MNIDFRKKAVMQARRDGVTLTAIAEEIGTTGANLSEMLRRKSSRSKYLEPLDCWLIAHGYGRETIDVSSSVEQNSKSESCRLLASELRAVADVVGSPILAHTKKRDRWIGFIRMFGDVIFDAIGVATTITCDPSVTPGAEQAVEPAKAAKKTKA